METLRKLFTDAKFVSALAIVIVAVAAVFGVQWTEVGVQNWIAEVVGAAVTVVGALYALKRGTDKTTKDDTTE